MKLDANRCPVVLVGAWNRAIFSPQWVLQRVFPLPEVDVEVGFAPQAPVLRYLAPNVALEILPGLIRVVPRDEKEETLQAAENAARAVLDRLPETPVHAVGLNYGFDVDRPSTLLEQLFDLPDAAHLLKQEMTPRSSTVRHAMEYDAGGLFSIQVSRSSARRHQVDLNFHWDVPDAVTAAARITERVIKELRFSRNLVEKLYSRE